MLLAATFGRSAYIKSGGERLKTDIPAQTWAGVALTTSITKGKFTTE
jgi:hypothetical protein